MNLVAGIITCSIPGALKECCSDNSLNFEESKFKSTLLSCIEDSIRGILEEDGTLSNGLMEDIKELVVLVIDTYIMRCYHNPFATLKTYCVW